MKKAPMSLPTWSPATSPYWLTFCLGRGGERVCEVATRVWDGQA